MTLEEDVSKYAMENKLFDEAELAQVLKKLDEDAIDNVSGLSSIDFNARLTRGEVNASIVTDELVRLGLLRKSVGLSRQKKRLSVSLEGKGREEKVRIVAGEREQRTGGGFFKNLFTKRD